MATQSSLQLVKSLRLRPFRPHLQTRSTMSLDQRNFTTEHRRLGTHASSSGDAKTRPGIFDVMPREVVGQPKFISKEEEREHLKGRLAAAFRIFAANKFDEGVAGHITLRDPVEPHTFWVNPFGVAFRHIRKSDLVRVNYDGTVLEGGPIRFINRAAVMIHAALHKARDDVHCAAHSHSIHGRTFSGLGIPLQITSQDGCAFYNDLAMYNQFEGIVLEEYEGENIAKAMGAKKAAILANHGLLTASDSVEATVFWFLSLEKLCYSQLLQMAAVGGDTSRLTIVGHEEAARTYENVGKSISGRFSAKPLFDEIAQLTNEDYLS